MENSSHTFLPFILAITFSQGHLVALHFSIGSQGQNFSLGLKVFTSLDTSDEVLSWNTGERETKYHSMEQACMPITTFSWPH